MCLICMCFIFFCLHLFNTIEHVSHGKGSRNTLIIIIIITIPHLTLGWRQLARRQKQSKWSSNQRVTVWGQMALQWPRTKWALWHYFSYVNPILVVTHLIFWRSMNNDVIVVLDPNGNRLVSQVVKASAPKVEGPEFESRLRWDFFGSSHTSDFKVGIPVWLPCQAPGVIGPALGLVGPVSVYCDWVRYKVGSATSISVW